MKVKVKSWTAVATWKWIANDDNCGICRMAFDGCCPDCKMPGDDCPIVWGQCSHVFHMHCILKWLNSQPIHQQCPMCRQEWKFKEWWWQWLCCLFERMPHHSEQNVTKMFEEKNLHYSGEWYCDIITWYSFSWSCFVVCKKHWIPEDIVMMSCHGATSGPAWQSALELKQE